jgi:hypothetical protein
MSRQKAKLDGKTFVADHGRDCIQCVQVLPAVAGFGVEVTRTELGWASVLRRKPQPTRIERCVRSLLAQLIDTAARVGQELIANRIEIRAVGTEVLDEAGEPGFRAIQTQLERHRLFDHRLGADRRLEAAFGRDRAGQDVTRARAQSGLVAGHGTPSPRRRLFNRRNPCKKPRLVI